MSDHTLFYSSKCPDTPPFLEALSQKGVLFESVDILENLPNLKRFLRLRDCEKTFEKIKAKGNIGIPCLVLNTGEIILSLEELKQLKD